MQQIYDMVIVGGGPAGYTAALYGARAGLSTLLVEKMAPGGQMLLTEQIDNYPGFEAGVDGFTLSDKMRAGAERFGAQTLLEEVTALTLDAPVKTVQTTERTIQARTVVLAMGAVPRTLGLPGEEALTGQGVHYCAACDGMFYRGKTVAVVGGGDTAAADALLLARVAAKVYLIHRRDTLRATKIYHAPLMQTENVEFCWNSVVTQLHHGDRLHGLTVQNTQTGAEQTLDCDAVFVSIGRMPATELVAGQLELAPGGYIPADESTRTALPGVFAVGDVRTKALRQVVTAVADGAMAVHSAEAALAEERA